MNWSFLFYLLLFWIILQFDHFHNLYYDYIFKAHFWLLLINFTYNLIISFLQNIKVLSSSFTMELEVFSKIFFELFLRVKYTFIKLFFPDELFIYLFASLNSAELTIIIIIFINKYCYIYFLFLICRIFLSPFIIFIFKIKFYKIILIRFINLFSLIYLLI